jgi:hypothetical protein
MEPEKPYGENTHWIIFDDDTAELLSTHVYESYDEAVKDAPADSRIIAIKL